MKPADTLNLLYGPYSASRLQVAECGYAFRRIYIDKDYPDKSTAQADRGNVIHLVLEEIGSEKSYGEKPSKEFIEASIQKHLQKFPAAIQELDSIQKQCHEFNDSDLPLVLEYTEYEGDMAMKLTKEHKAIPCDWDDPAAFARGKIDILTYTYDEDAGHIDHLVVYDHKTQINIDKSFTLQLKFYLWMIRKQYPLANEIQGLLHFTRYNKYEEGFILRKGEDQFLQEIEDEILGRIRFTESRTTWEASTCDYCKYCPFNGSCPETKDVHKLEIPDVITSQEQALTLLDKLVAIKPMERKIDRIIREFVEKYELDALDNGKVRYGYKASERIDWSAINKDPDLKEEVVNAILGLGMDPTAYMGFSKEFSRALLFKRTKKLRETMIELIPTTTVTSFRKLN